MTVKIVTKGFFIELSGAEAQVLIEELGGLSAKGHLKIRQLHRALENALYWSDHGAMGHDSQIESALRDKTASRR